MGGKMPKEEATQVNSWLNKYNMALMSSIKGTLTFTQNDLLAPQEIVDLDDESSPVRLMPPMPMELRASKL